MITHIRMKNFKSWKDSGEVKLAPLTGFFGTNSSGKSSLLQMLLLLKQTAERSDLDEVIFFGDKTSLVNLGNFREVIHGHKEEELLELEFGCKFQKPLTISLSHEITESNGFTFDTAIHENSGHLSVKHFSYIVGTDPIQKIKYENGILYGHPRQPESLDLSAVNVYSASVVIQMPSFIHSEQDFETDESLKPIFSAFEELFSHVYYLGPTRAHPQRDYHWGDKDPKDVGLWGDKVIDALLCAHMRRVKISKKGEEVTIEDRVSEWLREMDLAYSFSLEPIGALKDDNYEVRIRKSATSPAVPLTDIGYGLSDLLPMLVLCYYTPEGSILILEQPGVHLHPRAQSDLADLLIEVITERNLQILMESHSEHLLTRLQLRIAEQKISSDQTALYSCENNNGVSNIRSLDVDELGNITNWPPNFFGNVRGDLAKMTREQMKRQKVAEG